MPEQAIEQKGKDRKSQLFHLGLGLTLALSTKQEAESLEKERARVMEERAKLPLMDQPMDASAWADKRRRIGSPVNSLSNVLDCACLLFGGDAVKQAVQRVMKEKSVDPNSIDPPKVESFEDFVRALQWAIFTFNVYAMKDAAASANINLDRPELYMPKVEKPTTLQEAICYLVQLHNDLWVKPEDLMNPGQINGWRNTIAKKLTKQALQMVLKLVKDYRFCITTKQFFQDRPGYIIYDCNSSRILLVLDTYHIKIDKDLSGDSGIKHVFGIFEPLLFKEANLAGLKHRGLPTPKDVARYLY